MNIGYNEKIETLILALHRGNETSQGKFGQSWRDAEGTIHIRMFDGKSFTASRGPKFWHIENVAARVVGNDPDLLTAISYAL